MATVSGPPRRTRAPNATDARLPHPPPSPANQPPGPTSVHPTTVRGKRLDPSPRGLSRSPPRPARPGWGLEHLAGEGLGFRGPVGDATEGVRGKVADGGRDGGDGRVPDVGAPEGVDGPAPTTVPAGTQWAGRVGPVRLPHEGVVGCPVGASWGGCVADRGRTVGGLLREQVVPYPVGRVPAGSRRVGEVETEGVEEAEAVGSPGEATVAGAVVVEPPVPISDPAARRPPPLYSGANLLGIPEPIPETRATRPPPGKAGETRPQPRTRGRRDPK